jgi:PPP family 3-phenylpropionic acid transporter
MSIRIGLFFATYFLLLGIQLPYFPVWLADARELGPEVIGWVVGAGAWSRVLVVLIGRAADRSGERKRPILLLALLTALGIAAFGLASGFGPLLVLSALVGLAYAGMLPLADALALDEGRRLGLDYGRMRLWGSLAFIAAALGSGALIDRAGSWIVLPGLVLAALMIFAAALGLPDARTGGGGDGGRVRDLLRQPGFVRVALAGGLIQASHAVYYGFGTLHWQAAGLSGGLIGWLWAEGVIAEVILFAFSGAVVARLGAARLLWLAGGLAGLRWLGTALTTAPEALVLLQWLHGASFGATHLGTMFFLRDALPNQLLASGQALYAAGLAVLMGTAIPLAGFAYATFGGGAFVFAAAAAVFGALVAFGLSGPRAGHPGPHGS